MIEKSFLYWQVSIALFKAHLSCSRKSSDCVADKLRRECAGLLKVISLLDKRHVRCFFFFNGTL